MLVLAGCEESQVVTQRFRAAGHEAYSSDILPTRGNPDWHIQGDVMDAIPLRMWDLIILHPDCTHMAVCNNRRCAKGKPHYQDRLDDIEWTMELWELAKKHSHSVCLENPLSVIFPHLRRAGALVQYIQPHQFGHGETKNTGLALHNLEPLKPTNEVEGREQRIWKMGPSPTRKRDRSETYQGIADAFVEQFTNYLATRQD